NSILITGESGVGKEITARKLHELDPRTTGKPFVAVNCGALTETLLEAELFGYEKGAFTGANRTKRGVFEQADGGTLFLDEIGDMPLVMQVKLLRVLQDRQIVRVGGEEPIGVNLRLICATHRDLKKLVEQGTFREDLYYRVNVIKLTIPPLRERSEDVLWYARKFIDELAGTVSGPRKRLSPSAEQTLLRYPWPGNIRELRHCVERACILSEAAVLEPSTLFEDASLRHIEVFEGTDSLAQYLKACEQTYIQQTLAQNHGHLGNTAASLGISRKNLWEKMRKLGLSVKSSAASENDDPQIQ
ncbi:MAG: sigma-54-dependent Fis family transcriptional regulator, partial [Gammaproteobacteria bacterium]|nr:sigma-54-dependent Fis family transcriptional regulator [Gammaproteobacteria bacterium]